MANTTLRSIVKIVVTIFAIIAFSFAILFVGLIISQFLQSNEFSFYSIIIAVSFIGISILIAGQSHLLGHFAAGKALGFRLISYHFREISMISCEKVPSAKQHMLYYAAGSLCNLGLGSILLLAILFLPIEFPALLWLFLFALSLTLLFTGLLQTLPYYNEGVPTDGKIFWGLLFHSDFSRHYIAAKNLSESLTAGMRPAQIPMPSYKEEDALQSADSIFLLYLYYKALDLEKAPVMLKYNKMLENNFAMIPQHLQPSVICELCYASILKGQHHLAKSYFSLMKTFSAEDMTLSYYRTCAYYFFYCKNNCKQALTSVSYALELYASCPYSGMATMENTLLQALLQEITNNLT